MMNARTEFDCPSEHELTEWFGCVPEKDEDFRYRYRVSDRFDVRLIFSFDVIEASIQTIVTVGDAPVTKVVHEGARRLWLEDLGKTRLLRAEYFSQGYLTQMTVEIEPRIRVEWSTLRSE